MANTDSPFGFRPYGPVLRVTRYFASCATVIGQGELVIKKSTGVVGKLQALGGTATTTLHVVGAAANFVSSASGTVRTGAGTKTKDVYVYDHPSQQFVVQVDDATIDRLDDLGNYPLVAAAGTFGKNSSINRTTGQSKYEIDGDAKKTLAGSGVFQVRDWYTEIGFDTTTANVKVIGTINPRWHYFTTSKGTA